jgi:NAD dependent epimerase/dehydratase
VAGTVLVTGAGGFIGSHLCERLVADGHSVRALCRYTSRRSIGNLAELPPDVLPELDLRFGDLKDSDYVRDAVDGAETIYHLGASVSVPYSFEAPREVVTTNILGTLNVLAAAKACETPSTLQMSSSEVYGTAQYTPIDEDHPLHAQSPYAASKVGADKLAETFCMTYELPVVVARPFNTFGPRQSLRAVIPTIVTQAIKGGRLELGSLTTTRDFVFVKDTVEGLIRLASEPACAGDTFNIATGSDISVGDVVGLVGEILGRELEVVSKEERIRPDKSEVHQLLGSPAKLKQAVGWEPTTPMREGLEAVVEWFNERADSLATDDYAI